MTTSKEAKDALWKIVKYTPIKDYEKSVAPNWEIVADYIKQLENQLSIYENPYDEDVIASNDVANGSGYVDGHAWIGRVKANTKYRILVIEEI